mmetsp:Transcript_33882/g.78374  ORF Transcript_33882/g.78374 Transcript_33882/m.78374 type:complete len:235 (-) Transcript_33882:370-1074(-)
MMASSGVSTGFECDNLNIFASSLNMSGSTASWSMEKRSTKKAKGKAKGSNVLPKCQSSNREFGRNSGSSPALEGARLRIRAKTFLATSCSFEAVGSSSLARAMPKAAARPLNKVCIMTAYSSSDRPPLSVRSNMPNKKRSFCRLVSVCDIITQAAMSGLTATRTFECSCWVFIRCSLAWPFGSNSRTISWTRVAGDDSKSWSSKLPMNSSGTPSLFFADACQRLKIATQFGKDR